MPLRSVKITKMAEEMIPALTFPKGKVSRNGHIGFVSDCFFYFKRLNTESTTQKSKFFFTRTACEQIG